MKKNISIILVLLVSLSFFTCKKEYDSPPQKTIAIGNIATISYVKQLIQDSGSASFSGDMSIFATVTADENSGNLYKTVYIQDGTAAIPLNLTYSGGVYEGDSIRLYLKGTYLKNDNGTFSIDSVNVDKNIIKLATLKHVQPKLITIDQISDALQGYLVKFENVQFTSDFAGQTYANKITQASTNAYIEDCAANTVLVRNSGYAKFAGDTMPKGNGTFIGVLGSYGGTAQLYIRNVKEIVMPGSRCPGTNAIVTKNFDNKSLTSGGWIVKNIIGSGVWTIGTKGGVYGQASNYINSTKINAENWLISPAMDFTNLGSEIPLFSFDNTWNFSGPAIEVLISTNYDGTSNPNLANWTALNPILSPGGSSFPWVNSGKMNLAYYKAFSGVYIAFKYTGSTSSGSTWEIDNIKIGY